MAYFPFFSRTNHAERFRLEYGIAPECILGLIHRKTGQHLLYADDFIIGENRPQNIDLPFVSTGLPCIALLAPGSMTPITGMS